jgi:hypothetical protein
MFFPNGLAGVIAQYGDQLSSLKQWLRRRLPIGKAIQGS